MALATTSTLHFLLRLKTPPCSILKPRKGFTLIEILTVIGVIALMIALIGGSTGVIGGAQGMTAVNELTALCDLARSRSMDGQGTIMLAFSTGAQSPTGEPYRSAIICAEDTSTDAADDYVAVSEWYHLPRGYVFSPVAAASPSAGGNVLTLPNSVRKLKLPGGAGTYELPCVGFGSLGEVVFPEPSADTQDTLLIAIAEGEATANGPVSKRGQPHRPDECRWVAVRRNSGTPMILP